MSENITDAFLLQFVPDDKITGYLNEIAAQAAKGVTVGISMDADVTKVVKKIEQISKLMQTKIGGGTFDFDELFNLKSAIGELGDLSKKFKDLSPIFKALNDGANSLTASMTQIASLKLDAGQFNSLQESLKGIENTIGNISNKLDSVGSASGMQKVTQGAKEATKEIQETTKTAQQSDNVQVASGQKVLANYERIVAVLNKIAELRKVVNAGDQFLVPEYNNGHLQRSRGMYSGDIRGGQVTKTAIKDSLSQYNQYKDAGKDSSAERAFQRLTACVAAYKNLDEAQTLFGKKNQEVWNKVVANIEAAKAAKEAYEDAQIQESAMRNLARDGRAIKWTFGENDQLLKMLDEGNIQGALDMLTEKFGVVQTATAEANAQVENLQQNITEMSGQTNASTADDQMQNMAQSAASANANVEKLEQNMTELSGKLDSVAAKMEAIDSATQGATNANVTGTVDIGNKVAVTGGNGEQLALEKTLRATYNIQQNMVKILSEINSKMVSGAEAATASYEQLKAVMTETVEAAKAMGAEEEKESKQGKKSQTKERYAIIKNAYKEMIRLKKQLPNAGEEEAKQIEKQIKHYHNQIDYQKKKIAETKTSIALEEQKIDTLKRQADIQNAINADARKEAQSQARKIAANKLESSYNTASKTLRSVGGGNLVDTSESRLIQDLIVKFKEYDVLLATVNNDFERLSDNQQQEIQESIDKFNQLTQAQKTALKSGAYNTYNKSGQYKGYLTDLSSDSALSGLKGQVAGGALSQRDALEQVASSIAKAKLETVDYNEATGELTATYRDQQKNMQQITVGFQDVGNATRHTIKQTEQYQSTASKMFSSVGSKLKELLRYFSSFTIIMSAWNAVKQGVTVVTELNTALTELQVVTQSNNAELERFTSQAQQVAKNLATTTTEVTQSATEWARLGYSMADALELAEVAASYSKVGFTDINVATENLTATLQAFYADDIKNGIISAGDAAAEISDKLVYVGNKFASSADGMGQGITAAGAALVAANNSLDESLAMITAGTTILQDEDETANALRTISLRLRGTKASELEEAGETDLTGVVEDASKLYSIVKNMTSINGGKGVEIIDADTGAYKSTYQILLEISKVWEDMTDMQQAGLLETIAGEQMFGFCLNYMETCYYRTHLIALIA